MRSDQQVEFEPGSELGLNLPGRFFQDGVSQSGRERNHLFLNLGGTDFRDVSGVSGLDHPADGRSFARLDFDRDGREDLAVVNANAPLLQLFRNETPDVGGVIALRFEGANRSAAPSPGRSSRSGIGARVEVSLGDRVLVREHRGGEGFAAQNSATLLIGIGGSPRAERVTVRWPSGAVSLVEDVKAGSLLVIHEDASVEVVRARYRPAEPLALGPEPESAGPVLLPDRLGHEPLRVLTTMATWCETCRSELPQIAALRAQLGNRVALLGVPVDETDSAAKLRDYLDREQPAYELLLDLSAAEREAVQRWVLDSLHRDALPATIVTDGEGRVLATSFGVPSVSALRRLLRSVSG